MLTSDPASSTHRQAAPGRSVVTSGLTVEGIEAEDKGRASPPLPYLFCGAPVNSLDKDIVRKVCCLQVLLLR